MSGNDKVQNIVQKAIVGLFFLLVLHSIVNAQLYVQEIVLTEGHGFGTLVIGSSKVGDVIQLLGKPDSIEETTFEYSTNYIYSSSNAKL